MPTFTIETTYHLPIYRHRTYEADTLIEACRLAIKDDGWSDEKSGMDNSGETYVSGVWQGLDAACRAPALLIPSQFSEAIRRKADHFETLLGVLKILAHVENLSAPDLPYWLPKARAAIAKAEAILASALIRWVSPTARQLREPNSCSRSTRGNPCARRDRSDHRVRFGADATGRRRHHQRRCPCGLPCRGGADRPVRGTWRRRVSGRACCDS